MGQGFFERRRNERALRQVHVIEQREGRQLSTVAVQGTQKFEWSHAATIMLGIFLVMFVAAALFGFVIYPGGLVLVAGYNATKPRRTVSLNGETVTVWEHSFWTSKVISSLVIQPRSFLEIGAYLVVPGTRPVTVSTSEVEALERVNAELGPAPVPVIATPPPPSAPNPSLI